MEPQLIAIGVALAGMGLSVTSAALLTWRFYRRVPSGQALVISQPGRPPRVSMSGALVLPVIQMAEAIDLTTHRLVVERRGPDAYRDKDGAPVDWRAVFQLRVEPTDAGILRIATRVGCGRATDPATLRELFDARFSEAFKVVLRT